LEQNKLKIFTDFDGTVTLFDVWMEIGDIFIRDKDTWTQTIRKFENQEICTRECFIKECELMVDFDLDTFDKVIARQRLDPKFPDFYEYCKSNNFPITILSEGMDYYISGVLKKYGLDIPFYSNRIIISEDKKSFEIDFPYSDSDCTKCGTSKRNILMNNTADDEISVYIGDGFSDTCVVNYADIVFAKRSLASYCWKNNITYFEFQTFGDIIKKIDKIKNSRKLKQRDSARNKRREVFLRG